LSRFVVVWDKEKIDKEEFAMRRKDLRIHGTVAAVVFLLNSMNAIAAVCNVPSGSHPTIQEAANDLACTEVVIAAGSFVESVTVERSLDFSGDSSATTTVEGRFVVTGASTNVSLSDLAIDAGAPTAAGCYTLALYANGGAVVTGNNLVVVNADGDACLLFADGFEAGNTGGWSGTTP